MLLITLLFNITFVLFSLWAIKLLMFSDYILTVAGIAHAEGIFFVIVTVIILSFILVFIPMSVQPKENASNYSLVKLLQTFLQLLSIISSSYFIYKIVIVFHRLQKGYNWVNETMDMVIQKSFNLIDKQNWFLEIKKVMHSLNETEWNKLIQNVNYDNIHTFTDASLFVDTFVKKEMIVPLNQDVTVLNQTIKSFQESPAIAKFISYLANDIIVSFAKFFIKDFLLNPNLWIVGTVFFMFILVVRAYYVFKGEIGQFFSIGENFGEVIKNSFTSVTNALQHGNVTSQTLQEFMNVSKETEEIFKSQILSLLTRTEGLENHIVQVAQITLKCTTEITRLKDMVCTNSIAVEQQALIVDTLDAIIKILHP